jgi:predicted AAA+ superfamily ATPase
MIKRNILKSLQNHLDNPEMTILTGPRQVGKTYLMRLMMEDLVKSGQKTLFLNLDNDDDLIFFESQSRLVDYLKLQFGDSKGHVFIDEIQKKENAGVFLKGIYDQNLPYKFILSSSGSLDLKAKIKESMAGRKRVFEIDPISFDEFVNYKTDYKFEGKLHDFFKIEKNKSFSLLNEYLNFGGYPKVILAPTLNEKKAEISEIYKSYVEKDVTNLLKVEKPNSFSNLLKLLSSQIGGLVNVSELSATIGISSKTVENYLWYLEETYIIKKVTPYYKNIRSEITKSPIYYFVDLGLRNYLIGLFGLTVLPSELTGHLFENFVFKGIKNLNIGDIHFWRTRDNAEVDFVIEKGLDLIPVEVKYKDLKLSKTTRSFKSFLTRYVPKESYIIHLGEDLDSKFKSSRVNFINYSRVNKIK